MERARGTWTDERLDDLSRRMDQGFARVDGDLRLLRGEMSSMRSELSGRIDALQRTMIQLVGAIVAANLAAVITLIATR
jgi:hypothetical protein